MYKSPETVEDVLQNPKLYGLRPLDEYLKGKGNLNARLSTDDAKLSRIDKSTQVFRNGVKKHIYYFEHYKCRSLEEVQMICANEGIPFGKLEIKPQIIPDRNDPDKCDLLIRFERPLSMLLGIL